MSIAFLLAQTTASAKATGAPVPAAPVAVADAAVEDPAAELEQLQQMYRDTCAAREYGAYDDMCDQLRQQVRQAQRAAAAAARRSAARVPGAPDAKAAASPNRP